MIESIQIKNEASFDKNGQTLKGLKKVNILYGPNGSGKTTISKIINDPDAFTECSINWVGGAKLRALVYNRDFVDLNFHPDKELKGIFTLGEKDANIIQAVEDGKKGLDAIAESIKAETITLSGDDGEGGKKNELENLESEFANQCWGLKQKYDGDFKGAFTGVRDKREKFKARFLEIAVGNASDLLAHEELARKAKTIFDDTLTKETVIPPIDYSDLLVLEQAHILSKKVIGKDDVDIAAMIKKLGNSDWVKQGRGYFEKNDSYCPFCQQKTDAQFARSLAEYFNEEYLKDVDEIEALKTNYEAYSGGVLKRLEEVLNDTPKFLDCEKLKSQKDLVEARISANRQHIARKQKEASVSVSLESFKKVLDEIKAQIDAANQKAKDHNTTLDNLEKEKVKLKDQIWRFIFEENKVNFEAYAKKKEDLETAIKALESKILTEEGKRKAKLEEIQGLEKQITSIQPTIDEINALLSSFGFSGFSLAKSQKEGFYKLIRPSGQDAKETLSEGEKTFVTFLYFYHLLKGSDSASGTTADRVVVFDDPVSSLDSDILFIVSNLIKGTFLEICSAEGFVKQVFVLSHNVYFHKEISFKINKRKGISPKDVSFWTLKKSKEVSAVESHARNPIKTSYELLWDEIRTSKKNSQTIQNVMRRILENYFNIMGNIDNEEIINKFDGKEKQVCSSLFSWINDRSHIANDDLYLSCDESTVDLYLDIFKKIFEKTEHDAHYDMMMGKDGEESSKEEANDNLEKITEIA